LVTRHGRENRRIGEKHPVHGGNGHGPAEKDDGRSKNAGGSAEKAQDPRVEAR